MPTKFVSAAAEKTGVSVARAEEVWDQAKKAIKSTTKRKGHWYWGKVVNTFKRMMGLKECMGFSEFALLKSEDAIGAPKADPTRWYL